MVKWINIKLSGRYDGFQAEITELTFFFQIWFAANYSNKKNKKLSEMKFRSSNIK